MADQFYGNTDTGRERTNNEDAFIAERSVDGQFIIACVIDGVGGYSGGEVAAALTREAILQRLERPPGQLIPVMLDCFNLANKKILAEKKLVKEHDSMACVATLALIDIEQNQFHYVHVGDTRLYLLRDNSLVKISHDQSFVGFLEDSGRLTEEGAMTHPNRNEINKALGFENILAADNDYIETGQSPFLPGDLILLCSDGLTDMVSKAEITKIITRDISLKEMSALLISAANQHGGKDNITVVLAHNNKKAVKYKATKPSSDKKKTFKERVFDEPVKNAQVQSTLSKKPTVQKNSNWLIILLATLVVIFSGTTIFQYLKNQHSAEDVPKRVIVPSLEIANAQQLKLQAAIDSLTGNVLILNNADFTSPIIIDRPVLIKRDTLFIKTKGSIALQSDTAYHGVAIILSLPCKLVMLDSLIIKNFQTGIIDYNNALFLKNMRFVNCVNPIQNVFSVPNNKFISGTVTTFKADTIPVAHKHN